MTDETPRESKIGFIYRFLMEMGLDEKTAGLVAYVTFPPLEDIRRQNRAYYRVLKKAADRHAMQVKKLGKSYARNADDYEALARRTLEQYEAIAQTYGDTFIPGWSATMFKAHREESE